MERRNGYMELHYSAFEILQERYSYDEVGEIPLRDLQDELAFLTPKLQEMAKRREAQGLSKAFGG